MLTLATGARYRVGYDVRGRGRAYNVKIRRTESRRVLDAYLDAVRTIGVPVEDDRTEVHFSVEDAKWAESWLKAQGIDGSRPIVALNPGASWPAKTWSAGRFAELAAGLIGELNASVLLVAGPGQREVKDVTDALTAQGCPVHTDSSPVGGVDPPLPHSTFQMTVSDDIAVAVGTPRSASSDRAGRRSGFPIRGGRARGAAGRDGNCCGRDFCIRPTPCIESISPRKVLDTAESLLGRSV